MFFQLVETVVSDLSVDHGTEFHVIRLNGFVHTDDKLALREIWRQLGREMEVDDEGIGQVSLRAPCFWEYRLSQNRPPTMQTYYHHCSLYFLIHLSYQTIKTYL